MCAFEDCNPCNSGDFCVLCVCCPQPGHVTCTTQSGNCNGTCAMCKSVSEGQTCYQYVGCGGQLCPPNGCSGGGEGAVGELASRLAREGCRHCPMQLLPATEGMVLGEVVSEPGFPVEVVSFDLPEPGSPPTPGTYRIRNHAQAGLVTLVVAVSVESPTGEVATISTVADSWDRDVAFAGPGGEVDLPMSVAISGGSVQRLVVRPLFAEFDDGRRVGPGVASLRECIASSRRAQVQEARAALQAYQADGEKALELALQTSENLDWLRFLMARGGSSAVLRELRKQRQLAPW